MYRDENLDGDLTGLLGVGRRNTWLIVFANLRDDIVEAERGAGGAGTLLSIWP